MVPLNIPNFLTVLRILLVPVIVVALLDETPNGDAFAAVVFAVAAFTDGLDGYLARHRGSVTTFGKLMDPLADKLLIIAPLISLVSLDRIPAWVAMVIIAREFAVTALRMVAAEQGVVISASSLGKLKTVVQVAAIMAVIAFDPTPLAVDLLLYAAVAVTIVSGADYFFGLRRRIEKQRRKDERAGAEGGCDPDRGRPRLSASRHAAYDLGRELAVLGDEPAEQLIGAEPPRLVNSTSAVPRIPRPAGRARPARSRRPRPPPARRTALGGHPHRLEQARSPAPLPARRRR